MNPNTNEPWSGLEEVAVYLGVNKDTIRNWIKRLTFRLTRLGGNGNSNCLK